MKTPYGRCPRCGANCAIRERRPNGNDTCENGHVYPSREAVVEDRVTPRKPDYGELYFSGFESDWEGDLSTCLTISEVEMLYDDGIGWSIWASDGVGYDCYWSDRYSLWVYNLDMEDDADE